MGNVFEETDWRDSWIELQENREKLPDSTIWDAKAESFASRQVSSYSRSFVEYLDLDEGDTVLDMGCGTGELAVLMAEDGHEVHACDFSDGMLGYLVSKVEEGGLDSIHPAKMAWEDDWAEFGLGSGSVDVAIASRSIMVPDLYATLEKLSDTARRKVAVTLSVGCSPSEDPILLEAIGRSPKHQQDAVFCINMLFQMGYLPELRYIEPDKLKRHATAEDALAYSLGHVKDLTEEERGMAAHFIGEHLERHDEEDPDKPYRLDYNVHPKWAFISWDV